MEAVEFIRSCSAQELESVDPRRVKLAAASRLIPSVVTFGGAPAQDDVTFQSKLTQTSEGDCLTRCCRPSSVRDVNTALLTKQTFKTRVILLLRLSPAYLKMWWAGLVIILVTS